MNLAFLDTSDGMCEIRRMSEWWNAWTMTNAVPHDVCEKGELCLNEAAGNVVQHSRARR